MSSERYNSVVAPTALLSEAEYLRTSFPDGDREFYDGELRERGLPTYSHGETTLLLGRWFVDRKNEYHLFASSDMRMMVAPRQWRLPDIVVFWPSRPTNEVPEFPPLIAIEVVSPDDSYSAIRAKLAEYRACGVKHTWIADPIGRSFLVFDGKLNEVESFHIPEVNLTLTRDEIFAP